MSYLENVDIMLGGVPRNNEISGRKDSDSNQDSESNRLQQNSNLAGEDFIHCSTQILEKTVILP